MRKTQIYITNKQDKKLRKLKKITEKTITQLIREAIDKIYFDGELKNEQSHTSSKK